MNAVIIRKGWFSNVFKLEEVQTPEIKDDEVLLTISGIGVTKNDFLKGIDVCPGIECSGVIAIVGRNVQNWKAGERVCALLDGGAYAEQAAVPAKFLLRVPESITLEDAACLPYIACNIWLALFTKEDIMPPLKEETILIREGASGIGSLAIQFAKYKGMKVIAAAGTDQELTHCQRYGADVCINHTNKDFVELVKKETKGLGVNFVLDYGNQNFYENTLCCDRLGKVPIINLRGFEKIMLSFETIGLMHLQYYVVDILSKSRDEKAKVIDEVRKSLWPVVQDLDVVIEAPYSLRDAHNANKALKRSNLANFILFNVHTKRND
ncbi:hypothetical protein ACJIZ3_003288 [Penstemon smallii]|uniref:Enoyl reductase (ER) domain-containing protein n=1 Tax=Penstemon smallii TaxID=265156 RepID=A0ABD3U969_9LAMI